MLDRRLPALATLLTIVLGPLAAAAAGAAGAPGRQPAAAVARVGDRFIDRRDLELRQRILDATYPAASSPAAALAQLVESLLATELLAERGVALGVTELESEALAIDRETRMPALLARIRTLFAGDRQRYLTVFVRTEIAPSRLWQEFRESGDLQAAERAAAEAILARARSSWGAALEEAGLETSAVTVSRTEGFRDAGAEPAVSRLPTVAEAPAAVGAVLAAAADLGTAAEQALAQRVFDDFLAAAEPGAVAPKLLETEEGFGALRLVEKTGDGAARCEIAWVPKADYETWFWRRARQIPVEVFDRGLDGTFRRQVAWSAELSPAGSGPGDESPSR